MNVTKQFDLNSDVFNVGPRWTRRSRSFQLYSMRKGLGNPGQKKAMLLYIAWESERDIYFAFLIVTVPPEGADTVYTAAVAELNEHFTPHINIPFEKAIGHGPKVR